MGKCQPSFNGLNVYIKRSLSQIPYIAHLIKLIIHQQQKYKEYVERDEKEKQVKRLTE